MIFSLRIIHLRKYMSSSFTFRSRFFTSNVYHTSHVPLHLLSNFHRVKLPPYARRAFALRFTLFLHAPLFDPPLISPTKLCKQTVPHTSTSARTSARRMHSDKKQRNAHTPLVSLSIITTTCLHFTTPPSCHHFSHSLTYPPPLNPSPPSSKL